MVSLLAKIIGCGLLSQVYAEDALRLKDLSDLAAPINYSNKGALKIECAQNNLALGTATETDTLIIDIYATKKWQHAPLIKHTPFINNDVKLKYQDIRHALATAISAFDFSLTLTEDYDKSQRNLINNTPASLNGLTDAELINLFQETHPGITKIVFIATSNGWFKRNSTKKTYSLLERLLNNNYEIYVECVK